MSNEIEIRISSVDNTGAGFSSATAKQEKLVSGTAALGKAATETSARTKRLGSDLESAGRASDGAARQAGKFGDSLKQVGTIAAGVLAADAIKAGADKVVDLFKSTVDAASNLGESVNAVSKIFGANAAKIEEWADKNANSIGLSKRAFNELATPLGAILKNSGIDMDTVSAKTIELTERAADMASVFNTSVPDALSAVQAGLRGEADPLERYGVGLNAAGVV